MSNESEKFKAQFSFADVGDYSYGGLIAHRYDTNTTLKIGKFCSFGAGVRVMLGGEHRLDVISTFPFQAFPEDWPEAAALGGHPVSHGPIVIGNDVWIGAEAMIMSGVTIGDGAVVAARAVVTRDIPSYAVMAGIPAAFKRWRFMPETCVALQNTAWWDWSPEKLRRAASKMLAPNQVAAFLKFAEENPDP